MYDVIIIGAGPGGYRTAQLAGREGRKVAIIEKNVVGGVCLNYGCIPFKNYLHITSILERVEYLKRKGTLQLGSIPAMNMEAIHREREDTIRLLQQGILGTLKAHHVDYIQGNAKIEKAGENHVVVSVGKEMLSGKYLVIATGSEERALTTPNDVMEYTVISSKQILELQHIPQSMLIIGSGAIGLEAASFLSSMGCKVTMIEKQSQIGGKIDTEISNALRCSMEKNRIRFFCNASIKGFRENAVVFESEEGECAISSEYVLCAIGRKPSIDGLGLENVGIDYDADGIKMDDMCKTSNPLVFACGDVTGKQMLAHVAYQQARVIVDTICGKKNRMTYDAIPRIIYTVPELISVGLDEMDCCDKNIPYLARSLPLTYSGKYFAEYGRTFARAKMIVHADTRRLLGYHMVGSGASEIAMTVALMIRGNMTIEDIQSLMFPHPTVGEIIHELANCFSSKH